MNFSTYINERISKSVQTLGAINTLGEYIASKFNDLANFMSGTGKQFVSVLIPDDTHLDETGSIVSTQINKVCAISQQIYNSATENPDQLFALAIDDIGTTVSVSGQAITDACNDALGELKAQEQFITYTLRTESCDSNTFLTRVRALAPNIPGIVLDKFSTIIDNCGSPIECIKTFLESVIYGRVTNENQYISLVDPDAYVGNVWLSTLTYIGDTVMGFFRGCWEGIQHLDKFFSNLINAVKNLTVWAFGQLFGNLLTKYEKASNAPIGIMDLPIIQLTISESEVNTIGNYAMNSRAAESARLYSYDFTNHCIPMWNYDDPWENWGELLWSSLLKLTSDEIDGQVYSSVTEVVVPSYPFDVAIRIGRFGSSSSDLCFSVHIVADYGTWSKYSDSEIQPKVFLTLYNMMQPLSSIMPMFLYPLTSPYDVVTPFRTMARYFFDDSDDYQNDLELPQRLKTLGKSYTQFVSSMTSSDKRDASLVINSILSYAVIMSKGFIPNANGDNVYDDFVSQCLFGPKSVYTPPAGAPFSIINYVSAEDSLSAISAYSYKPYSKRNQLATTIHYQTMNEQVLEIIDAVKKILIAVVVVVATVKYAKWSRQRKKDTLLAHAAVDKLSWDVAADPNDPSILKNFNVAYKKMIRMDFVNGLLGLTDGSSGNSILNGLKSIGASIGKAQDTSSTTVNTKINDSVNPKLNTIDSTVGDVITLIRG